MTTEEITAVQETLQIAMSNADRTTELFYTHLFVLRPSLKKLFANTNAHRRGLKLVSILHIAALGLADLDSLVPELHDLGRRHLRYGARREDYPAVGAALLWTLEVVLGAAYTSEVRDAWTKAYLIVAKTVLEGAEAVSG